MKVHECVSFMLIDNNRVLLEKRSETRETDAGIVNIPGGHMEGGESQRQALIREMDEELNVSPESYQHLCSLYHPTRELQLIHYYVVDRWTGEISAQEVERVHWYPLAPAAVGIVAE